MSILNPLEVIANSFFTGIGSGFAQRGQQMVGGDKPANLAYASPGAMTGATSAQAQFATSAMQQDQGFKEKQQRDWLEAVEQKEKRVSDAKTENDMRMRMLDHYLYIDGLKQMDQIQANRAAQIAKQQKWSTGNFSTDVEKLGSQIYNYMYPDTWKQGLRDYFRAYKQAPLKLEPDAGLMGGPSPYAPLR